MPRRARATRWRGVAMWGRVAMRGGAAMGRAATVRGGAAMGGSARGRANLSVIVHRASAK